MATLSHKEVSRRYPVLLVGMLLAAILTLTVVQSMAAQTPIEVQPVEAPLAADLSSSTKSVSEPFAAAGNQLLYTIVISRHAGREWRRLVPCV